MLVLISAILGLSFLDMSIEFFGGSELQSPQHTVLSGLHLSVSSGHYCSTLPVECVLCRPLSLLLWLDQEAWPFEGGLHWRVQSKELCTCQELEEKFGRSQMFYKLKLVLQLSISIIALLINATNFVKQDFKEEFDCPRDCIPEDGNHTNQALPNCTEVWPLDGQFRCVYNSLRLLNFLHSTAFGLLGLTIVVLSIRFVWTCSRHATELGAKKITDFCFNSCLHPEGFSFTPWKVL